MNKTHTHKHTHTYTHINLYVYKLSNKEKWILTQDGSLGSYIIIKIETTLTKR